MTSGRPSAAAAASLGKLSAEEAAAPTTEGEETAADGEIPPATTRNGMFDATARVYGKAIDTTLESVAASFTEEGVNESVLEELKGKERSGRA